MRLIDADELNEHKFVGNNYVQIGGRTNGKTLENINKAYQQGWNDCIDAIIDNAPTVNPYFPISEYVFHQITDAEWEYSDSFWVITPSGKKVEFEKKRPKGKWIKYRSVSKNPVIWQIECNKCGYTEGCMSGNIITISEQYPNYCPNCGADMRGEE